MTITKKVVSPTPPAAPTISHPSLQITALQKSSKPSVPAVAVGSSNAGNPTKKRKVMEDLPSKHSPNQNYHNVTKEFKKWSTMRNDSQSDLPTQNGNTKAPKKFKREVSIQRSLLKFEDIGGMDRVLKELCDLLMHIKHPEVYRHIGLPPPRGFLLHGPPGCGKTLLAKAIAGV